MTDHTGRSFLSYRRARSDEAGRLVAAQHELGIPTWQDVHDLRSEPTADELRRVLHDPATANVVLFTTPEVGASPMIQRIEAIEAHARWKAGDGFFVQPIAAGGLGYAEASAIQSAHLGLDNFDRWNWERASTNPIDADEATRLAHGVLKRRLAEINTHRSAADPWDVTIHTRKPPSSAAGAAVALNWSHHFTGRECPADVWASRLIPAALAVADEIYATNASRRIRAGGLVSLPAAVALGAAFMAPRGMRLSWRQQNPTRAAQDWSLDTPRRAADVNIERLELDVAADRLAVVISINHDVQEAIRATPGLPSFRGAVRVSAKSGSAIDIADGGEAVDIAVRVIEEIKAARREWPGVKETHLFIAAPAGLAVMLGQLLNGLGPVQTYEHLQDDGIGRYVTAAHVDCSNR